jgi:hypothetical protein
VRARRNASKLADDFVNLLGDGLELTGAGVIDVEANNDRHINVGTDGVELYGTYTNTTVNFYNSMTAAQIQALIDAQPKYIEEGTSLTFQFADGTYTLNQNITFQNFHGGGNLFVQGNTGESGLHTNQAVVLDFSASSVHGLTLYSIYAANIYVRYIHAKVKTDAAAYVGLELTRVTGGWVTSCYFEGTSTTNGRGIEVKWGFVNVDTTYFSNTNIGLYLNYPAFVYSNTNDDTGTAPKYGIWAKNGSWCSQFSTQPSGSVADHFQGQGSIVSSVTDLYLGEGTQSASPQDYTLHQAGAWGSDVAAGDFYIAGGRSTGNATPGRIILQTSTVGASGTTLQSLANRIILATDGIEVSIPISTPEIYYTSGDLKIQPDVQGDVHVFGDTDVADGSDGKAFVIWRMAAEGNVGLKLWTDDEKQTIFNADGAAALLFQLTDSTFLSVDSSLNLDFQAGDITTTGTITGGGAKCRMTPIGGYAIALTNKTGANSVAGQLVKADAATDDAVILTAANDTECMGVFLDSGIADGSEAWVVVAGIADVAMEDNTAATRGNWVETSNAEAGYADATSASPAAAPGHFEEIGHCIETVAAGGGGTHILARCVLHFN